MAVMLNIKFPSFIPYLEQHMALAVMLNIKFLASHGKNAKY